MSTIKQYLKVFSDRFLKLRGRPREMALGFSLGIFIGLTPSMGIQIAVAIFIASIFKWSKITAALGVQITNPLTAPFIYGATYFIGAKIIGLEKTVKLSSLMTIEGISTLIQGAPKIFAALTIGAVFLGVPLAFASYFSVYWLICRYQENIKTGIQKKVKKIKYRLGQRKKKQKKDKTLNHKFEENFMDRHFLITVSDQKSAAYGIRFIADFFSDKQEIKATLFYSVPKAPVIFENEKSLQESMKQKEYERKILQKSQQALDQAKLLCVDKGFKKENVFQKAQTQIFSKAADIILEGENRFYDAAVIGRRGLSLLEKTFEDSTSQALFKEKFTFPLWLCRSSDPSRRNVLLFVDGSAASLRMADHVGFILGHEKQHKIDILATESILSQPSLMEQYASALHSNGVTPDRIKTRSCEPGNPGKSILKIMKKESYAAVALGRSSNEPSLMVRLFRGPVCSILFNDLENATLWLCP